MNTITNQIDNAINNLLNITQNPLEQKDSQTFSNLVNTLGANVEKTQSDFVKKATKTNTSSINKYALKEENKAQKIDKNTESTKKTKNDSKVESEKPKQTENTEKTETETDSTQTDKKVSKEDKEEIKQVVEDLFSALDIDLNEFPELKIQIEETIDNIETIDDCTEILNKIESLVNQSNLTAEEKTAVLDVFNAIEKKIDTKIDSKIQIDSTNKPIETTKTPDYQGRVEIKPEEFEPVVENEKIEDIVRVIDKLVKKSTNNTKNTEIKTQNPELNKETIEDLDIEPDLEIKVDTKKNNDTKSNLNQENKDKEAFLEKIKQEMNVQVKNSKIPNTSGALSVSDEVIKMAINEETPNLNPINQIDSQVLQGKNLAIKNLFNIKTPQSQTQKLDSFNILNQIGDKLTQLKDGVNHKLTMVLRPNDLGRLSIELTTGARGLSGYIVAQNEDVRAYIEKNMNVLQKQLVDSGVNINNIQIKTQGSENSTNWQGADNQEQNSNQDNNNHNQGQKNQQSKKEQQETLANFSNYDLNFSKDFSNVLNKTISYALN